MIKLRDVHLNYDTDKGTSHSYIETYDLLFSRYQNLPINFCEIGVMTGGSLKLWNEYFPVATIYGLDIWLYPEPKDWTIHGFKETQSANLIIKDFTSNYPRVKLITCDSTNSDDVDKNFKDKLKFDLIIDDGDHRVESQLASFQNMIGYLSNDGCYVIEDVEHQDVLLEGIAKFDSSLHVEFIPFYKNRRPDDALILVTKNLISV